MDTEIILKEKDLLFEKMELNYLNMNLIEM